MSRVLRLTQETAQRLGQTRPEQMSSAAVKVRPRLLPWSALAFTTLDAHQRRTDKASTARLGSHPLAHLPRRIVSYVLGVAAGQTGYPVALIILMEADDFPGDRAGVCHLLSMRAVARSTQCTAR